MRSRSHALGPVWGHTKRTVNPEADNRYARKGTSSSILALSRIVLSVWQLHRDTLMSAQRHTAPQQTSVIKRRRRRFDTNHSALMALWPCQWRSIILKATRPRAGNSPARLPILLRVLAPDAIIQIESCFSRGSENLYSRRDDKGGN
jgi:hypothetical protein